MRRGREKRIEGVKVNDCTDNAEETGENGSLFTVAWTVKQLISKGHSVLLESLQQFTHIHSHTNTPPQSK